MVQPGSLPIVGEARLGKLRWLEPLVYLSVSLKAGNLHVAPNFAQQNQVLIYVHPRCPNTHIPSNCNNIKVKYLLHRISHHNVITQSCSLSTLLHKRNNQPKLPQGLQLVNINLVILDILQKLFICIICYPSRIFIECKTSVSSPCLASISKGSMRLKGQTRFDCGAQFQLFKFQHPK